MSTLVLAPLAPVDLAGHRLGQPQRAGALTMVPVFGPAYPGVVPPRTGLKLDRVETYGTMVLSNPGDDGVAIVPLHMGYVQDGAQNHALCRSAFLAPGQKVAFADACCVQESQGGYLAGRDQWFFILPVELRGVALARRGEQTYAKLWPAIADLNRRYGLPNRGHLEQILSRKRPVLTQFQSRLERQPDQLGALFFLGERLVGVEIAPDPRYFAEVWMALVCFAYGVAAWFHSAPAVEPEPYEVSTLDELRTVLVRQRESVTRDVRSWLAASPWQATEFTEEERYLNLRLSTVSGDRVAGQVVSEGSRLVYASLFDRAPIG